MCRRVTCWRRHLGRQCSPMVGRGHPDCGASGQTSRWNGGNHFTSLCVSQASTGRKISNSGVYLVKPKEITPRGECWCAASTEKDSESSDQSCPSPRQLLLCGTLLAQAPHAQALPVPPPTPFSRVHLKCHFLPRAPPSPVPQSRSTALSCFYGSHSIPATQVS